MSDVPIIDHNTRQITYVPPDPQVIQAYARRLCAELGEQDIAYAAPEVVSGFTSFLIFISKTLAKHMSNGHKDFLLQGYTCPKQLKIGGNYVTQKDPTASTAQRCPLLHSQIVDTR